DNISGRRSSERALVDCKRAARHGAEKTAEALSRTLSRDPQGRRKSGAGAYVVSTRRLTPVEPSFAISEPGDAYRHAIIRRMQNELLIGLVSVSDRAAGGVYEDKGLPALQEWFTAALSTPWKMVTRLIPDEQPVIEQTLRELVDEARCHLVLTTGGTGPAPRDLTPEATLAVADKVMPGFGEQMRAVSLRYVPTAILSRQVAVIRGGCLIVNLPGQPKSIRETLEGVKDAEGKSLVHGIFAAIPYCV